MSDREAGQFSFVRAINALANPTDRKLQDAARFEFEASAAAASKQGRQSRGITVPYDVMRRDLTTSSDRTLEELRLIRANQDSLAARLRDVICEDKPRFCR
jgi:hypothetical protein